MDRERRLETWGQIAGYLNVSVRTAQNLEKQSALPVHRGPGIKAPVWAYPNELDEWKQASEARPPTEQGNGGPNRRRSIAKLIGLSVLSISVLFIVTLGVKRLVFGKQVRPNAWQVNGHTLSVFGEDGRELWRHTFPEELSGDAYKDQKRCVITDLRRSGDVGTLFQYRFEARFAFEVDVLRWSRQDRLGLRHKEDSYRCPVAGVDATVWRAIRVDYP